MTPHALHHQPQPTRKSVSNLFSFIAALVLTAAGCFLLATTR
jgi:hypothetical protein